MDKTARPETAWMFPESCYFFKKKRVQYKGKKVSPCQITTYDADKSIKAAAKGKANEMYVELKDLCLIAKEFKYHVHCYKEFTRGFTKAERDQQKTQEKVKSHIYSN